MRFLLAALLSVTLAAAAEDPLPGVAAVVSERIKDLPEPTSPAIPEGLKMAITTEEPKAQQHVLDGLNNLHGGWDLEAYRHFCAALELDPDCLMAHWGVVMSLLDPEPDMVEHRTAALRRMLKLVEDEAGTELERSYAYAVAVFLEKGAVAAADAFRKIAEKFPNDPQLKLLHAAFGRSGYNADGTANVDQEKAEAAINELLVRSPDQPLYLSAYLTIRAEAPDLRGDLARARHLCELAPGYAPFLHLLGHYELRNGNIAQAVGAFARAGEIYRKWMNDTGLDHTDCPGWVKSECYRAVSLAIKGDYANALAVADSVAAIDVPVERTRSEGGQLLLWEGRTLATRILMRRAGKGDAARAIAKLPDPASQKKFAKRTMSIWLYQGLAFVLEARKALEAGNLEEARKIGDALTLHGEEMVKTRETANAGGERSAWLRAFTTLEISASELRGLMALAGPKADIGSAFNWFRAALDRQKPASLLMPPGTLLPMEARLSEYYLAKGDAKAAVDTLYEAQGWHTNDLEILSRLETALKKNNLPEQAAEIAAQIEQVKSD
ncbi:tetratricopeptide repeat protein [Luteolibacter marinus]|uniref:tetratricopeptide repeat protein n=1 Tax=Luteolibacter marinus TaxID=2776705 RepID=UPI0018689B98|nr:hypothetical protein [Luteolibacter marinus]